jgi:hypothetical protein
MRAEVGDELVVRGRHVGDADREGVIIEIHGSGGMPPYLVRWEHGHESLPSPLLWWVGRCQDAAPVPARA